MKKILKPLLLLVMGVTVISCSDDDDSNNPGPDTSETAYLYATSHNGSVTRYDINQESPLVTYQIESSDAEGIYYDDDNDAFTIVSRDPSQLQNYTGVNEAGNNTTANLPLNIASTENYTSGRDIAEDDDLYVVADNSDVDGNENTPDGRFLIYTKSATGFQLRNTVKVNFSVWGIVIEDNKLYAVVDKTNELAVFDNFLNTYTTDVTATPSKQVAIEGIVRTHGLDLDGNTMVMTDIGDAASDSDGAIHIINNFSSVLNDTEDGGIISLNDQIRIAGSNTNLGNPVNVVYDEDYNTAYVAELANAGGRILAFNNIRNNAGGNISPQINNTLAGASSVYLYTE